MISHIRDTVSQVAEFLCRLELGKTSHEIHCGAFNYIDCEYRDVMKTSLRIFSHYIIRILKRHSVEKFIYQDIQVSIIRGPLKSNVKRYCLKSELFSFININKISDKSELREIWYDTSIAKSIYIHIL